MHDQTQYDRINELGQKYLAEAKTVQGCTDAIDWLHGIWIGALLYEGSKETRDLIDRYQGFLRDQRDQLL